MNTYTLPQSSYYETDYSPITFNLDEVIQASEIVYKVVVDALPNLRPLS